MGVLEEEALKMSPEELTQAIIGTIGDLDSPMTADTKGYVSMTRYLTGVTTKEDLLEYAAKLRAVKETGSSIVFGSQAALDEANKVLPKERALVIESAIPSTEN